LPPVVEVRGVTKTFDHHPVLRGIDFTAAAGDVVAVLGANGSGKTTLLRLIATILPPTRGTVTLFGQPASPRPEVRRRIGMVAHESFLYDMLTVEENLVFFAGLYRLHADRVTAVLAQTALRPIAHRRVRILSRGQRQQANLARALLHDPDLLVLDEPYTGLDLDMAGRLTSALRDGRRDRTILLTTHEPAQARAVATGAAVLTDGRLGPVLPPEELDATTLAEVFGADRR
jgi:heme ABC exporter ATP-binding subunit CcmA